METEIKEPDARTNDSEENNHFEELANEANEFVSLKGFLNNLQVECSDKEQVPFEVFVHYWRERVDNPELPPLFIEHKLEASDEELDSMSERHIEFYTCIVEDFVKNFDTTHTWVLNSGMYGGKTTLAVMLARRLEKERNISFSAIIEESLGEEKIVARAFGEDGTVKAKKFGRNCDTQDKVDEFVESLSDLILYDEYTFSDPNSVLMLMKACREQGKKLILLGLDNNAFGKNLDILDNEDYKRFIEDKGVVKYMCKSFVDPNGKEPTGTSQIRYLYVPELEKWVLDIALGRLIISKEFEKLVWYRPCAQKLVDVMGESIAFNSQLDRILKDLAIAEDDRTSIHERLYWYLYDRIYDNER